MIEKAKTLAKEANDILGPCEKVVGIAALAFAVDYFLLNGKCWRYVAQKVTNKRDNEKLMAEIRTIEEASK